MALPIPGMVIERPRTALVITDLQNDFLSPGGAAWGLVKDSLAANNTVENIEALLRAARDGGYPVFLSPSGQLKDLCGNCQQWVPIRSYGWVDGAGHYHDGQRIE